MAYATGQVSGCHLNPPVSVGLLVGKRFSASERVPYVIAQVLGGIVAAIIGGAIAGVLVPFVAGSPGDSVDPQEQKTPPVRDSAPELPKHRGRRGKPMAAFGTCDLTAV